MLQKFKTVPFAAVSLFTHTSIEKAIGCGWTQRDDIGATGRLYPGATKIPISADPDPMPTFTVSGVSLWTSKTSVFVVVTTLLHAAARPASNTIAVEEERLSTLGMRMMRVGLRDRRRLDGTGPAGNEVPCH